MLREQHLLYILSRRTIPVPAALRPPHPAAETKARLNRLKKRYRFLGAGERTGAIRFAQTVLLWKTRHWRVFVVRNSLGRTAPALSPQDANLAAQPEIPSWMGRFGRSERGPAKRSDEETHSREARVGSDRAQRRAQACRTGPPLGEYQLTALALYVGCFGCCVRQRLHCMRYSVSKLCKRLNR